MHGLIFVTWEKFLLERLGNSILQSYREAIQQTAATIPLTSRIYDDSILFNGIGAVAAATGIETKTLLREYGRYFILNNLTNHLCTYLLTRVHTARDLLLIMRSAHAQMRQTSDAMAPPLFSYETFTNKPNELVLIYDSHRHLCPILYGAIEGAAERFGEKVKIVEVICMQRGATHCRFELRFSRNTQLQVASQGQQKQQRIQKHIAHVVLQVLPGDSAKAITLQELLLHFSHLPPQYQLRPSAMLGAILHLQHAGLIGSTADQPGDTFTERRYWKLKKL